MFGKKVTKIMLALAVVAIMLLGSTLAYLSTTTTTATNVFTFTENISATLTEPAWDPDNAEDLTPGADVPKDPRMTNTSPIDEYCGIKLEFTKGDGTTLTPAQMTQLLACITFKKGTPIASATTGMNVGTGTTAWTYASGYNATQPVQILYYNSLVPAVAGTVQSSTSNIFDWVTINSTCTNAQLTFLRDTLGGFNIKVTGAAVQADAFTNAAGASADLVTLLTA